MYISNVVSFVHDNNHFFLCVTSSKTFNWVFEMQAHVVGITTMKFRIIFRFVKSIWSLIRILDFWAWHHNACDANIKNNRFVEFDFVFIIWFKQKVSDFSAVLKSSMYYHFVTGYLVVCAAPCTAPCCRSVFRTRLLCSSVALRSQSHVLLKKRKEIQYIECISRRRWMCLCSFCTFNRDNSNVLSVENICSDIEQQHSGWNFALLFISRILFFFRYHSPEATDFSLNR